MKEKIPCTRFLDGGADAVPEEHMRDCNDCLENKRILHAMAETHATAVSAPGWADGLLAQIEEEEVRRRSAGSGVLFREQTSVRRRYTG